MAKNTALPNLKLVRKKGLGTLQTIFVLTYYPPNHVNNHGVILTQEGSRNNTNYFCISVQVLNLRFRMTKCSGHLRTDSSLIVQNWIYLRGIQSAAKNLFFIFLRIAVISNRKMRELFFIVLLS